MTDETVIYEMQTFSLGETPDGFVVLLLGYATSQEKLSRREMESFAIAISPEKATALANALLSRNGKPAPRRQKRH